MLWHRSDAFNMVPELVLGPTQPHKKPRNEAMYLNDQREPLLFYNTSLFIRLHYTTCSLSPSLTILPTSMSLFMRFLSYKQSSAWMSTPNHCCCSLQAHVRPHFPTNPIISFLEDPNIKSIGYTEISPNNHTMLCDYS